MKKDLKHFLLVIICALLMSSVKGQSKPNRENDFGVSIAINSIQAQIEIPLMTGPGSEIVDSDGNILTGGKRKDQSSSFSIIPKYNLNNNVLLRFEFGLTNLHLVANSEQKQFFEHVIGYREVKSKIYRYTPGFQWTFMKTKKIESYCGITGSFINYKPVNNNWKYEYRDLGTDTLLYSGKVMERTPGGFAVGLGALAGFNIYLYKQISIGAELSSSVLYYKLGGLTTTESTEQVATSPASTTDDTSTNSYSGFKISKIISSFNISFSF